MATLGQGRLELGCRTSLRHTNPPNSTDLVAWSRFGLSKRAESSVRPRHGCGGHLRPERVRRSARSNTGGGRDRRPDRAGRHPGLGESSTASTPVDWARSTGSPPPPTSSPHSPPSWASCSSTRSRDSSSRLRSRSCCSSTGPPDPTWRSSAPTPPVPGSTPPATPDAVARPDVIVARPEGGLFYVNADAVRHDLLVLMQPTTTAVVLDAKGVPPLDVTVAEMLTALQQELQRRGILFLIARDVGQVRHVLDHADAADLSPYLHPTVRDAIASLPSSRVEPTDERLAGATGEQLLHYLAGL